MATPTTTTFVAVQCFQCSTMQVKQQRRSANKWQCAVCGRRQSLRRVHARSAAARDVRPFVQAFNLSRAAAGQRPISPPEAVEVEDIEERIERRRTDWSEYLDDDRGESADPDGDWTGPELVTELPSPRMIKRARVRSDMASEGHSSQRSKEKPFVSVKAKFQRDRVEERGESCNEMRRGDFASHAERGELQTETRVAASKPWSKWSGYLEESEVAACEFKPSAGSKAESFQLCGNWGGELKNETRIAASKPRSKWSEYLGESEVAEDEFKPSAGSNTESFEMCGNWGGKLLNETRMAASRVAASKPQSKWSEYLEESEVPDDEFKPIAGSKAESFEFCENWGGFGTVVEEVHPDFL